jgi:CHAD domain-containing protein
MTYLDTFDWRLYHAGARLAVAREPDGSHLLFRAKGQDGFSRQTAERIPEFAWDIAAGPLRDAIEPLIEVRRLLPRVEWVLDVHLWTVLDERQKTVAELVVEHGRAIDSAEPDRRIQLESVIRIIPVAGEHDVARRLRAHAERSTAVIAHDDCRLEGILQALGRDPLREGARPRFALQPKMRADQAMKAVYRVLLDGMLRNEEGIRADLDTEFLHDFRVAVRRMRSGLAQVPQVFPRALVADYRDRFAWLGQRTGPLRDLDVHLLALPHYRDELPEELHEALEPVERQLKRQRAQEQERLVRVLGSRRYRQLVDGWRTFLDKPAPRQTALGNAKRPILDVANQRISRVHLKVIQHGRAIDRDSEAERLHRLRIDCKKLRYLLEFFIELYPRAEMTRLVRALKKLQNNLGDFNDLTVQRQEMLDWQRAIDPASASSGKMRSVVQLMLERTARCSTRTRRQFEQRFDAFAAPEMDARFVRLFGGHGR